MSFNRVPYKEEPFFIPYYDTEIRTIERFRVIIIDEDENEPDSENNDDE